MPDPPVALTNNDVLNLSQEAVTFLHALMTHQLQAQQPDPVTTTGATVTVEVGNNGAVHTALPETDATPVSWQQIPQHIRYMLHMPQTTEPITNVTTARGYNADLVALNKSFFRNNKTLSAVNVIRPDKYWMYPERKNQPEEKAGHLSNPNIKFDRHGDYFRGNYRSKHGNRLNDTALPEFHQMYAAKKRLLLSKTVIEAETVDSQGNVTYKTVDPYGKIAAALRLEVCMFLGYFNHGYGKDFDQIKSFPGKGNKDSGKGNNLYWELFIRFVVQHSEFIAPGIKASLLHGTDLPTEPETLPENADAKAIDEAQQRFRDSCNRILDASHDVNNELTNADKRYYLHPFEYVLAEIISSIKTTFADGKADVVLRDDPAHDGNYRMQTAPDERLRAWYREKKHLVGFCPNLHDDDGVDPISQAADRDRVIAHYEQLKANGFTLPPPPPKTPRRPRAGTTTTTTTNNNTTN